MGILDPWTLSQFRKLNEDNLGAASGQPGAINLTLTKTDDTVIPAQPVRLVWGPGVVTAGGNRVELASSQVLIIGTTSLDAPRGATFEFDGDTYSIIQPPHPDTGADVLDMAIGQTVGKTFR